MNDPNSRVGGLLGGGTREFAGISRKEEVSIEAAHGIGVDDGVKGPNTSPKEGSHGVSVGSCEGLGVQVNVKFAIEELEKKEKNRNKERIKKISKMQFGLSNGKEGRGKFYHFFLGT